ncbi:hypothetical protein Q644_16615 [Brucella intermedia 229E]|uniref:Uncharacterized protein n=1 Tax=Brucella intermedia 229E TaxID=1337887 RepID=U4VBQ7_9HYPH|nr:hypothetical protein Q644_16615 [Brucella intermedia 229E]
MQLRWKRTVVGGEARPGDFIAYTDWGGSFCRILRNNFGPSAGTWRWNLVCSPSPFQDIPYGMCDSKEETVSLVKRMFEELRNTNRLEFQRPYMWNDRKSWYQ